MSLVRLLETWRMRRGEPLLLALQPDRLEVEEVGQRRGREGSWAGDRVLRVFSPV